MEQYDLKISWFGTVGIDFTVDTVKYQFAEALKEGVKSIYIELNSPGGGVSEALGIVDLIKKMQDSGVVMHCNVVGECASAATAILAAFKRRSASYATFLFHEVWMQFQGSINLTESKQTAKMLEAYTRELAKIYVEGFGFDEELAYRLLTGENVLNVEEAYALGILNEQPAKLSKELVYNLVERDLAYVQGLLNKNKQNDGFMSKVKFNFKKVKVKGQIKRAVFALDLETDKGLLIILADELEEAVGMAAMHEDGEPADGEYTLEDGTVIKVEDGIVTEVVKPEIEEAELLTEGSESEPEAANKEEVKNETSKNKVVFKRNVTATPNNSKNNVKEQVLKRLGL